MGDEGAERGIRGGLDYIILHNSQTQLYIILMIKIGKQNWIG